MEALINCLVSYTIRDGNLNISIKCNELIDGFTRLQCSPETLFSKCFASDYEKSLCVSLCEKYYICMYIRYIQIRPFI